MNCPSTEGNVTLNFPDVVLEPAFAYMTNGSVTVASTGQAHLKLGSADFRTGAATLGVNAGSAGAMLIDSRSVWTGTGVQTIGASGSGQFDILASFVTLDPPVGPDVNVRLQGEVTTSAAVMGQSAGGHGEANVYGLWNTGDFTVGDAGTAEVNILHQNFSPNFSGKDTAGALTSGTVSVAAQVGSMGTVRVTGRTEEVRARWDVAGSLTLGGTSGSSGGTGQLEVGELNTVQVGSGMKIWPGGILSVTTNSFLTVSGPASIAGTLEFIAPSEFNPSLNDELTILSAAGGVSGGFESTILPSLSGGRVWSVLYNPTNVRVKVVSAPSFSDDFDEDGDVDGDDLARWRNNFGIGATHMQGDADGDLDVDGSDFLTWQRQLGSPAALPSVTAVPEPAALALVSLAGFACALLRKRRQ